MAKYKSIVVTNAGLELIAAVQSGDTIEFTAVKTGAGVYDGTEVLSELTGLKDLRQTFGVTGITRDETVIKVRSVIDNNGLNVGYNITEIGLFAKNKNNTEILYAIVVAETGLEDYLPVYSEAPTTITSEMHIDVSSVDSSVEFQATIIPGTYVTVQDFEDYKEQQNRYEDSFVASIDIQGKTIIAKNKDGEVLCTKETQDTTYGLATITESGLMDSTDKAKLNGIEAGAQKNTVTGIKGSVESTYRTGNVNITKGNIGLGNVDNTSDANKPVSTAQQAALDLKVDTAAYEAKVAALERQDTLNAQGNNDTYLLAQQANTKIESHEGNGNIHITNAERTAWANKAEHEEIIGENLIPYPYTETTHTDNGIRWEDLGDGRIKASGTATADSTFILPPFTVPKGTYTISGSINVENTTIQLSTNGSYAMSSNWQQLKKTLTYTEDTYYNYCRILVKAGVTLNDEIFEPMLNRGTVAYPFQPHNLSRQKLRADIDAIGTGGSNVSVTPALASGTKVATITVDGNSKDLYAPTNTDTVTTVTTTGSGNAITELKATNGQITATKGVTFLKEHPEISRGTDSTSTATATHGGTITMIDSVIKDSNGHVTKVNTKTVTLPSAATKSSVGLGNVDNTSDANKPVSTAQQTAINTSLASAKTYTDTAIAGLINGAPTTLDTLKEIADAMAENKEVVDALDEAIGKKADASALTTHTANTGVHITSNERTAWTNKAEHEEIVTDNLLPYPYYESTHTENVITWTVNEDGTIGVSAGTPTADCYFVFRHHVAADTTHLVIPAGTYTISGGTSKIPLSVWKIENGVTTTSIAVDNGNGATFTVDTETRLNVRLHITSGTVVTATKIKPKLEDGDTKHPYTEYAKSRAKLRADVDKALTSSDVVDNLTSTSTTVPLSANQGNVLNNRVDSLQVHPYSLIRCQDIGEVTTTQNTYTLFNSRKISDYGMILITVGSGATDVRATMIVPRAIFDDTQTVLSTFYIDNQIAVKWASDTQITIYATSSSATNKYVNIYGLKADDVAI